MRALVVFRLAEQFLIRSEARAMQNKIEEAKNRFKRDQVTSKVF